MVVNFLYCIDIPGKSEKIEKTNCIRGWLLCSYPVVDVRVSGHFGSWCTFNYGISRPDLNTYFPMFPGNLTAGFNIETKSGTISLSERFPIEVLIKDQNDSTKSMHIELEFDPGEIQGIEID